MVKGAPVAARVMSVLRRVSGPPGAASVEWRSSWLFSWHPPFQKLAATRISIDRQTGRLEGEILGPAGEAMGLMDMQCEPRKEGQGPAPRF